jgi:alkanesulfonate monooxygenase SsuD/methylene tetrahydromethanopterin reductase-like flavin-dependent oxidoreductase (luciferase family)
VPALERGRAKAGLAPGLNGFAITAPAMIAAGDTDEEIAAGIQAAKQQIGFYGSTPAYRPVLELHGWGDLQDELKAMTKRGEWDKLADAIDDEILHTFAIVGTPDEAVAEAVKRYGDIAARITIKLPERPDEDRARLFGELRA